MTKNIREAKAFGRLVYCTHRLEELKESGKRNTISHKILNIPQDSFFKPKRRLLPDDMTIKDDVPVLRVARHLIGEYEFLADEVKSENPMYSRAASYVCKKIENQIAPKIIPPPFGNELSDEEMEAFISGYNEEVQQHAVFLANGNANLSWDTVPVVGSSQSKKQSSSSSASPSKGKGRLEGFAAKVGRALWIRKIKFNEDDFENEHFFRQLGYDEVNSGNKAAVSKAFREMEKRGVIQWDQTSYDSAEFQRGMPITPFDEDVEELTQKERKVLHYLFKEIRTSGADYVNSKQKEIAQACGLSTGGQGLSGILQSLEEKNWIAIQKNKRPYRYHILPSPTRVSKDLMNKVERELFTSFVVLRDKNKSADTQTLSRLHDIDSVKQTMAKIEELELDDSKTTDPAFKRIREERFTVNFDTLSDLI